jgi:hypothetical protein
MSDTASHPEMLARTQFQAFGQLCSEIALSDEEQRKVLRLSPEEWSAWRLVSDGGPVPTSDVPRMLLRIGTATPRLSRIAERADQVLRTP